MSDNTLQEFLVELGFKIDGNTEKKFNQSIKNAALQANLLADAIEGTMRVVAEGVEQMARNFASLEFASQRTKSSVQGLKDFSYAFSQIGGSAEGAQAMVEKFAGILRSNTGYGSWLKSFGVPTEGLESVDQVIALVRKLHQQYPDGTNYGVGEGIASQFGIDKESYYQLSHNLNALTEFRKQSNQTAKDLGLNSDEAAKKWKEFLQDFQQTSLVFKTVVEKVFTELEPGIQQSLEEFNQWLKQNEPAIKDGIEKVAGAIGEAASDFKALAGAIEPVISRINELIERLTGKSGLTFAIEAAFGFAAFSKVARFLNLFTSSNGTPWGWFGSAIGFLLADGARFFPEELNGPEGQKKIQEAEKGAWYNRAYNAVKKWWSGDSSTNTAASTTLEPHQKALLDVIAGPESGGRYDSLYGGGRLTDYSDHPRQSFVIQNGPNAGRRTSAAGRYQFLIGTWDQQAAKLGLKDFSPKSQDLAAWDLAKTTYRQQTGRSLDQDLKSGDPDLLAGISRALHGQWTSLPGGLEPGTTVNKFVKGYAKALVAENKAMMTAADTGAGASPRFDINHPAFSWAKNVNANLGAINSGAPLGLTPSVMNNARTITVSPTTHVTVNGATDPSATANAIGNRLDSVNANVLRDTKGAVR